jgi:hypothetical protein
MCSHQTTVKADGGNGRYQLGMSSQIIAAVWPLLALLGYLLVTCVLTILTNERRKALSLHDRIRECRVLRNKFMAERYDMPDEVEEY